MSWSFDFIIKNSSKVLDCLDVQFQEWPGRIRERATPLYQHHPVLGALKDVESQVVALGQVQDGVRVDEGKQAVYQLWGSPEHQLSLTWLGRHSSAEVSGQEQSSLEFSGDHMATEGWSERQSLSLNTLGAKNALIGSLFFVER